MFRTAIVSAITAVVLATSLPAAAAVSWNGVEANGLKKNGIEANGVKKNGIQKNSVDAKGLRKNGLRKKGADLDGLTFAVGATPEGASAPDGGWIVESIELPRSFGK